MIQNIIQNKSTRLFIILGSIFITNAFIAEIIGVKIFSLEKTLGIQPIQLNLFNNPFTFNLTAGVLLWPIVFILTDIINEYYGKKGVQFLTNITVGLLAYAFLMYTLAIKLVPADWWIGSKESTGIANMQVAFTQIFGQGIAIIAGSLVAFLLGQIIDVVVFHRIKKITGEKYIWLRSTGSTLISQFIDSFVVLFLAFYLIPKYTSGQAWSLKLVLSICVGNYIYKFLIAVLLTPVIYIVHYIVEQYLGSTIAEEMKTSAQQES